MRCKHGDLAVIVNDFEGCEGNLGVIVEVIGPPENHPETPLICWQVVPVRRRKLWLVDDVPTKEFVSKRNPAMHPDAWLLPITGGTPALDRAEAIVSSMVDARRHQAAQQLDGKSAYAKVLVP